MLRLIGSRRASGLSALAARRLRARGRRRARPRRPRAGPACGSAVAKPVLELVAGPRQRARAGAARGCACIQAKSSVDAATRHGRGAEPRGRAGSAAGARLASRLPAVVVARSGPTRCEPQRSCSRGARLAVLVAADRDVLGAVVGGERAVAQRRAAPGASESEPADQLLRRRRRAGCGARPRGRRCAPTIEAATPPSLERQRASGSARLSAGRTAKASASRAGPRSQGCWTREPISRLRRAATLTLAVVGADGAGPGGRPVDEHAVRERHPAEPDAVGQSEGYSSACLLEERLQAVRRPRRVGARARRSRSRA